MRTVGLSCGVLVIVSVISATAGFAEAQTGPSNPYGQLFAIGEPPPIAAAGIPAGPAIAFQSEPRATFPGPQALNEQRTTKHRPFGAAMMSLYAGHVALQTLDAHSTFRALDAGSVEANPLVRWATSNGAMFVAVKTAATAVIVYSAEKIREKHPKRALIYMAAINAAYTAIVIHNYKSGSHR